MTLTKRKGDLPVVVGKTQGKENSLLSQSNPLETRSSAFKAILHLSYPLEIEPKTFTRLSEYAEAHSLTRREVIERLIEQRFGSANGCAQCGQEVVKSRKWQRYCSAKCRALAWREQHANS